MSNGLNPADEGGVEAAHNAGKVTSWHNLHMVAVAVGQPNQAPCVMVASGGERPRPFRSLCGQWGQLLELF